MINIKMVKVEEESVGADFSAKLSLLLSISYLHENYEEGLLGIFTNSFLGLGSSFHLILALIVDLPSDLHDFPF